jgi:hypothetical protein
MHLLDGVSGPVRTALEQAGEQFLRDHGFTEPVSWSPPRLSVLTEPITPIAPPELSRTWAAVRPAANRLIAHLPTPDVIAAYQAGRVLQDIGATRDRADTWGAASGPAPRGYAEPAALLISHQLVWLGDHRQLRRRTAARHQLCGVSRAEMRSSGMGSKGQSTAKTRLNPIATDLVGSVEDEAMSMTSEGCGSLRDCATRMERMKSLSLSRSLRGASRAASNSARSASALGVTGIARRTMHAARYAVFTNAMWVRAGSDSL